MLTPLQVLAAAAGRAGLEEDKVKEYLNSNAGEEEVNKQAKEVRENFDATQNLTQKWSLIPYQVVGKYGRNGVPFFVIEDKYAISGAREPEAFEKVFAKVLAGN